MAEQTSLVAQQVRLMHWAEQIRECQNRPEGMDVSTWCEQNNITKANYYYRLKRVRQMCLDQLPEAEKPAFVELPRLKAERTATVPEVPVMCIKNGNGLSADIFSSVSPRLLRFQFELDPYDKNTLFCSAEEKTAGSRHFCGKAMVSFSCTKGWITVLSGGQGRQMKQWPSQMTSTGC